MKYKLSALLLFLICMLSMPVFAAQTTVTINSTNGSYGENVEIPVVLSSNTGFSSLGIEIDYDTNALELISVLANSSVNASFTKAQAYDVKPYNMGWSSAENNTFNGTLATLTFKVLTKNPGVYPVTVSYYKGRNGDYTDGYDVNYDENFNSLNLKYVSGSVTVLGENNNTIDVTVNGNKVSYVTDDKIDGTIVVGLYDENDILVSVKTYTATELTNVSFTNTSAKNYSKVMWWDNLNSMKPLGDVHRISLQ